MYRVSYGRVTLKSIDALSPSDWSRFYGYFRDREIAAWNGSTPTRYPFWLFKRLLLEEHLSQERYSFGVYLTETAQFIGSVELYDLYPYAPDPAKRSTLGIIIGERSEWSKGYGREAIRATLLFCFQTLYPPMDRVRLSTFLHNKRAQAAFLAAGFVQVGQSSSGKNIEVLMECTREHWQSTLPKPLPPESSAD